MKKKLLCGIVIALAILFIGGGIYMVLLKKTESKNTDTVGTFKLKDYSYYIENFPSDKVLGSINSAQTAKENAEVIWVEIYGESTKEKKPYEVSFDDENQVWFVQGTLPKNWDGGVPHILIQKADGTVLAVWHDK